MLTPNVDMTNKTVLVTGAAGFIGSGLVKELLQTVAGGLVYIVSSYLLKLEAFMYLCNLIMHVIKRRKIVCS